LYWQLGRERNCRYLRELDRAFADNMAAKDSPGRAFNDHLTETNRTPVDYGTHGLRVAGTRHNDVVAFTCFRLAQANMRVFRIGEAAYGADLVAKRVGWATHRVRGRRITVMDGVRYQHHPTYDVARRVDVWDRRAQMAIYGYVAPVCSMHTRALEIEADGIGLPAYGHDDEARSCRQDLPLLRPDHAHPVADLVESLNATERLVHVDT
jgi:hypothetical protein